MLIRRPALLLRLGRWRHPEIAHVSAVDFPCLLIDDDGWVLPCADDDELQQLTEPDFTDEIVTAFDASARPLAVYLVGPKRTIALQTAGEPRTDELTAHVSAYFHHWTDQQAPAVVQPVHAYVAYVAEAVRSTPTRRRRRR